MDNEKQRALNIYPSVYFIEVVIKNPDTYQAYECQRYDICDGRLTIIINPFYIKHVNLNNIRSCKITKINSGELVYKFDENK